MAKSAMNKYKLISQLADREGILKEEPVPENRH